MKPTKTNIDIDLKLKDIKSEKLFNLKKQCPKSRIKYVDKVENVTYDIPNTNITSTKSKLWSKKSKPINNFNAFSSDEEKLAENNNNKNNNNNDNNNNIIINKNKNKNIDIDIQEQEQEQEQKQDQEQDVPKNTEKELTTSSRESESENIIQIGDSPCSQET